MEEPKAVFNWQESSHLYHIQPASQVRIFSPHAFSERGMQFNLEGRRPHGARQWATCIYNADIFYGNVPFLKTVAAVSMLISWLTAWLTLRRKSDGMG